MEKKSFGPFYVVIGLMVLTVFALAYTVDVAVTDEAGVRTELPSQVGEWQGTGIMFCHTSGCFKSFLMTQLNGVLECHSCGEKLHQMSIGEARALPEDTVLRKKQYRHSDGRVVSASLVLSGDDRSSIHRPQVCLLGQGNEIVKSTVLDIPIARRKSGLGVMLLDLLWTPAQQGENAQKFPRYYAYWFVGKDRETPHHIWRMVWMGYDRIVRNVAHRWAYISISGNRAEDESIEHHDILNDFIGDFYPLISLQERD